ncbi:N-acetyl-gamma-glutamyl-phosphate reductase [[Haemophilus] ducreyi]|uniref:N-acetyl-gamma-glutamyl-phosphate reductase n=1 Tax=Haemophilus ducreyi TaxID=730 RepID=UPI000655E709|nr:N-acetyl-gamma-glutamyl-phosphate reductase [[Haemophilus] ducreyi]AKO45313.1 N-acetyl-gamma-glutamyl-phosphate reductase [[Haemophilus] ducreyi]AKO46698.1 N-acetyl-gamma-glutamyl-phosphate reductase [[Haemophilus] ducreyi]AKO48039.1 N-acetyl-gamma-glutamyl-phosphate reductase [[Haemophilus] ducreyi]AKO49426.1 N-acetyl-gamma-glutamyl-phosphate reductase [[Haemophilus] ducreyi]ANF61536.1 N-acetyl-gamma-glutamyl-phosphate reductase [[Haemophilus] ducreyi]
MSKYKIFVDGAVGTTGLGIFERLRAAKDIELLTLADEQRKDLNARLANVAAADLTLLCLPDTASKQLVLHAPPSAKICDTSTAHRVDPAWVYGFAELSGQFNNIQTATRVAIPGCHATGYIALLRPLIEMHYLNADYPFTCHSLTGYSGGGKAMIAAYQAPIRDDKFKAPRMYGLTLHHKHLAEMCAFTGSSNPPIFTPIVADYYSGMLVNVPLPLSAFTQEANDVEKIYGILADYYREASLINVHYVNDLPTDGMVAANSLAGKDRLDIFVYANQTQVVLSAIFDNLGKGASGAAIQCMNIMLGRDQLADLHI